MQLARLFVSVLVSVLVSALVPVPMPMSRLAMMSTTLPPSLAETETLSPWCQWTRA
jgi:hypothetical protein